MNSDTLFVYSETVSLMQDNIFNTRNILRTAFQDITAFSGEDIYNAFKGNKF